MNAAVSQNDDTPHVNPWLVAFVVSIATFMEVLDTTITNVSITHIAGSLAASPEEGTWVLTSYLVSNGIVLPLSGWLAGVIGRKRFFMMCILGFTLASLACGMATSLESLIFFRLLQGLAGGGLQPIQQAIVLDSFPPAKRGLVFAITGITLIAAPVIGPTFGGWITDNFNWRWIFLINVPVGIIAFLLTSRIVYDPPHARAQGFKNIDFIGLGLVALCLGTLQIFLDKGQQDDWFDSNFITMMFGISSVALVCGIAWLLRQKDPVMDLRLLKDRGFALGCVLIFMTGFTLYGSISLLPMLVQSRFGYDAMLSGLVLSPGGIVVIVMMPIIGRMVSRVQARYLIATGLVITGIGMYYTSTINPVTDFDHFMYMRMVQAAGLPFLFIPISTLAYIHIPKEKSSKASAIFALSRNLGGSVGIALASTFVARMTQVHQQNLVHNIYPGSPVFESYRQSMTNTYIAHGMPAGEAAQSVLGHIYQDLVRQSAILAYSDAFLFLAALMAAATVLTFFLPRNDPHHKASPDAAAH